MKRVFVTGTDTEIGKTVVAAGLVRAAVTKGWQSVGLKPVAAGCTRDSDRLINDDALQLMAASNIDLDYATVNPIALEPAIAPHIAAAQANCSISAAILKLHYERNLPDNIDLTVYEGAGGWFVPLNEYETFQEFAVLMNLEVLLVVGMKLGCINHALLTVQAIKASGLSLVGWVANFAQREMKVADANIESLIQRIHAPLLGVVPHMNSPDVDNVAKHLNINSLMS